MGADRLDEYGFRHSGSNPRPSEGVLTLSRGGGQSSDQLLSLTETIILKCVIARVLGDYSRESQALYRGVADASHESRAFVPECRLWISN